MIVLNDTVMSKKKNKTPANVRPTTQKLNKQNQIGAQVTTQQFSGPVPHPEILQGYDQVLLDICKYNEFGWGRGRIHFCPCIFGGYGIRSYEQGGYGIRPY